MAWWFATIRQIVVFLLGVLIILDALTSKADRLAELIIGTILVGVLPVDSLVRKLSIDDRTHCDIPSQTKQEAPSAPD